MSVKSPPFIHNSEGTDTLFLKQRDGSYGTCRRSRDWVTQTAYMSLCLFPYERKVVRIQYLIENF